MHRWMGALVLALAAAMMVATPAAGQSFICFGDSITYGNGGVSGGTPQDSYLPHLAAYLAGTGPTPALVNAGDAGDTTLDGIDRINLVLDATPNASTMLVMLGTNDLFTWVFDPTLIDPDRTRTNLVIIASQAEGRGVTPILATVPPRLSIDSLDPMNTMTATMKTKNPKALSLSITISSKIPD